MENPTDIQQPSWLDNAIDQVIRANENNILVLMRNEQDQVIVTNADKPEMVWELGFALCGMYMPPDSDSGPGDDDDDAMHCEECGREINGMNGR